VYGSGVGHLTIVIVFPPAVIVPAPWLEVSSPPA